MEGIIIDGPDPKSIGHTLRVPMSCRYSIRTAVKESIPSASIMTDIIAPLISPPPRRSRLAAFASSISGL
eukprot:3533146-Rhodomonas_salina.1